MEDSVLEIVESLSMIEKDATIPKNVRQKVKTAMDLLASDKHVNLKVDQSLEALNELCDDPNLQPYIKMQIWSIVSQLESR